MTENIVVDDTASESAQLPEKLDRIQHETVPEPDIPSRDTKPIDKDLVIFLLILLPIFIAAFQFCLNPTVRNFYCARALQLVQQPKDAIPFYTAALKDKPDALTFRYRGDAYGEIDDPVAQRNDLMESLRLNPNQHEIYDTAIALQVRGGNPQVAAQLIKQYGNLAPHDLNPEQFAKWRNRQTAYNLLSLDDTEGAQEFLSRLESSDKDKKVIDALISRQRGNLDRSREIISSLDDSREPNFYRDSRVRYNDKIAKDSIQMMLALDERKPSEARAKVPRLQEVIDDSRFKKDLDRPVIDVLQGWLLLEENRIDECLKLSEKLLQVKELNDTLDGLNLKAALHLMRRQAFLKQNNLDAAAQEERMYKDTHCSGRLFTPLWAVR